MNNVERLSEMRTRNFYEFLANIVDRERSSRLEDLVTIEDIISELQEAINEKFRDKTVVPVVQVLFNKEDSKFQISLKDEYIETFEEVLDALDFTIFENVKSDGKKHDYSIELGFDDIKKRYDFSDEAIERLK